MKFEWLTPPLLCCQDVPVELPYTNAIMPPRPVLQLLGIATDAELASDQSISDLKADLMECCQEFGSVVAIEIPTHAEPGEGSVFVEFSQLNEAIAASHSLHNRRIDERIVMRVIKDWEEVNHDTYLSYKTNQEWLLPQYL